MTSGSLVINESSPGGVSSFSLRVGCSSSAVSLSGTPGIFAEYSKTLYRIAPSANPMKRAKSIVSEYAGVIPNEVWPRGISGCGEASIVRLRSIALSRLKPSVSGIDFRFRLP